MSYKFKIINFLILAAGLVFSSAVFAETFLPSSTDIPSELVPLANELGCDSKEACQAAFNNDLSRGIALAERYGIYDNDPETKKLAQTFKQEVLEKLATAEGDDFEEKLVRIAENIVSRNKKLAVLLDVNKEEVTAAKIIINQIKEEGVSLDVCNQPADLLTREQLIACLNASKKLAENKTILKNYISEERLQDDFIDQNRSITNLQTALDRGEYGELGAKNADELGNVCLRSGSSGQCDEIAKRFFGQDGVKYLNEARAQVSNVAEKYLTRATNFTLVTPRGQNITGENAIRDTCSRAFNARDIELASVCGKFAKDNGFITQEDFDESVEFLKSIQGSVDLSECRKNPKACEQFIPQDKREEFKVNQQVNEILTAEVGFSLEECSKGGTDQEIGQRCFQGSKQAISKLESLAQNSPQVWQVIDDIKRRVAENERVINKSQEFQQLFQNQGGPGGCRSPQECSVYCSDPAHGPECIAFGAKHQVFEGYEAVNRFQEYRQRVENAPGQEFIPPQGNGAFQSNFGQSNFKQGFSNQMGPSPECFAAIQNGDFIKAKELCSVSGATNLSAPIQQVINICPAMPTVDTCPEGQEKYPVYSSPECGAYYSCRPKAELIPVCPPGQYWDNQNKTCFSYKTQQTSCGPNQYWDYNRSACVAYDNDPVVGCARVGGTWDAARNYCNMPGQSCSSGQYWNGNVCVINVDPVADCRRVGGVWDSAKNYCQMPTTVSCYSIGGDESKCRSAAGCVWYQNHYDGSHCDDPAHGQTQTNTACNNNNICEYGESTGSCPNDCQSSATTCPSGQYWNGTACVNTAIQDTQQQKEQIWNTLGLRSQIRNDADPSRIEQLKQACANVQSGANVWLSGSGTFSSPDFGMPSQEKCQTAANCSSAQYFNGDSCVSTSQTGQYSCVSNQYWDSATQTCKTMSSTACSSGQYWNGNACATYSTDPAAGCAQAGGAWDTASNYCRMPETNTACNNNKICEYGESVGSCPGDCQGATTITCSSGQYWNGTACVSSTTTNNCSTPSNCFDQAICASSGWYWYNGGCWSSPQTTTTTTCPAEQYWDGTACVSSTTTTSCSTPSACTDPSICASSGWSWYDGSCHSSPQTTTTTCSSGQYWDGSACVSSTPSPSMSCSSGQYWDGSACVNSPTPSTSCSSGQYWDGSACVPSPTPAPEPAPAPSAFLPSDALAAISGLLSSILMLLQNFRR